MMTLERALFELAVERGRADASQKAHTAALLREQQIKNTIFAARDRYQHTCEGWCALVELIEDLGWSDPSDDDSVG